MNKLNILLIEDDQWLADSLISGFSELSVEVVRDPEETFVVIDHHRPDVIVGDVILGNKNIFTLLNEMQSYQDTREIPIILISSSADRIDEEDVKNFNVKKIVDKSDLDPQQLADDIKIILKNETT